VGPSQGAVGGGGDAVGLRVAEPPNRLAADVDRAGADGQKPARLAFRLWPNTVAHEQRNRTIKLLARVLRASGQGDYTRVLAYHMFVHNVRAHARSAAAAALPDVYDFGRFYF